MESPKFTGINCFNTVNCNFQNILCIIFREGYIAYEKYLFKGLNVILIHSSSFGAISAYINATVESFLVVFVGLSSFINVSYD